MFTVVPASKMNTRITPPSLKFKNRHVRLSFVNHVDIMAGIINGGDSTCSNNSDSESDFYEEDDDNNEEEECSDDCEIIPGPSKKAKVFYNVAKKNTKFTHKIVKRADGHLLSMVCSILHNSFST